MKCPTCLGVGKVEKLGLLGFKIVTCKTCKGSGQLQGYREGYF